MKVGLFIPCYVNAIYPNVGIATYKLLTSLGLDVVYPLNQTCCGQPMANAGYQHQAKNLALRFEELFKGFDVIVGPSASCVAFVKENYPNILKEEKHCLVASLTRSAYTTVVMALENCIYLLLAKEIYLIRIRYVTCWSLSKVLRWLSPNV